MTNFQNRVLTTEEVADLLLCSDDDVIELAERGELPGIKYAKEWVFPESSLFRALHMESIRESEHRKSAVPSRGIPA